ncbi:MAG: NAD(P)-binding protein [Bacteroidia bacterium]|nr:NAD(P)-binding protein [Bacteroidia bacterium]
MTTVFDAGIIGGGLGGLTLAIQLAKKGHKVILFEKEKYPFHKVCGEYVSMESRNFLMRCGLKLDEMNLPVINRLNITAPNGNSISHNLTQGGFGISRYTLDALLVEQAITHGVIIKELCKVSEVIYTINDFIIHTSAGVFTSKFAFGSYGKRSNLDVKLKRKFILKKQKGAQNYIGVKYHIKTDHDANLIALHNFKNGYCGISKIEEGKYCLCYLTTEQNLKESGNDIKKMEQNILYKNPHLRKIFEEATFLYEVPLVISQINFEPKTQIENHIIMLGDAAGLITPLCGNGMSMAMRAADMLATLMPENNNEENMNMFESAYQLAWKNEFALRLKAGRIIQNMFGAELPTNVFISVLKPFPLFVQLLVQLTHGKPF